MTTSSHIHTAIAHDIEARRIAAAGRARQARIARRRAAAGATRAPRLALRRLPALRGRAGGAAGHGA